MGDAFDQALTQSLKLAWYMVVPTLAVPLVSGAVAIVQGFFGVRDDCVLYAIRLGVLVVVGIVMFPVISQQVVDLMLTVLR